MKTLTEAARTPLLTRFQPKTVWLLRRSTLDTPTSLRRPRRRHIAEPSAQPAVQRRQDAATASAGGGPWATAGGGMSSYPLHPAEIHPLLPISYKARSLPLGDFFSPERLRLVAAGLTVSPRGGRSGAARLGCLLPSNRGGPSGAEVSGAGLRGPWGQRGPPGATRG